MTSFYYGIESCQSERMLNGEALNLAQKPLSFLAGFAFNAIEEYLRFLSTGEK